MLREFAESHGIDFLLLSDAGSETITRLGLLNRHLTEQNAFFGGGVSDRHRGLPYPGTFVLDAAGLVADKEFQQSYRERPSSELLLARSRALKATASYVATAYDNGVTVSASVAQPIYVPLQRSVVHVKLELQKGLHVYCPPTPSGYTALSVSLEDHPEIQSSQAELPTGIPFRIDGLEDQFFVVEGSTELQVPFKVSGKGYHLDGRTRESVLPGDTVLLSLLVSYQACTGTECFPPAGRRLAIPLVEVPPGN